ncbi:hypothetical protein [Emticicia sp.]|uniref:hypothetical protein n=1 Tax=Emticicia sp. TaxID=1930953 RepID=UPI0037506AE7
MKTQKELNADILEITMLIQEKFPELSKYIAEMPVTIPNETTPEITIKILEEYYNSLDILLKDYDKNRGSTLK